MMKVIGKVDSVESGRDDGHDGWRREGEMDD